MDGVECNQIVELEARREVYGGLDEAKSKLASLSVVGFFWGDSVKGLEKELVELTILMSAWPCLGDGNNGVMIEIRETYSSSLDFSAIPAITRYRSLVSSAELCHSPIHFSTFFSCGASVSYMPYSATTPKVVRRTGYRSGLLAGRTLKIVDRA